MANGLSEQLDERNFLGILPQTPEAKTKTTTTEDEKIAVGGPLTTIVATKDEPIKEKGVVGEKQPLEFNRENFLSITRKDPTTLTEEDKGFLREYRARQALGEDVTGQLRQEQPTITGVKVERTAGEEAIDLIRRGFDSPVRTAEGRIISGEERIKQELRNLGYSEAEVQRAVGEALIGKRETDLSARTAERVGTEEERLRVTAEQEKARIEQQAKKRIDQLKSNLSFSGFGRSTLAAEKIDEVAAEVQRLNVLADNRAEAQLQLFRAQQEGADEEELRGLRKNLDASIAAIQTAEAKNAAEIAKLNEQAKIKGAEALDNLLAGLSESSNQDMLSKGFDKETSTALGYISDKFGNPVKTDAEGNPIAFRVSDIDTADIKVSTFKDANDNTFVYKNGILDSIVTNQGQIVKGKQLENIEVPAQIKEQQSNADRIKTETQLRKEFIARPEIKRFNEIRASFDRVKAGKEMDSAAGDLALIFSFMKMLDPGSVVREGEFANAQNAAGVPEQIRNIYNRVRTGKRLGAGQAEDFLKTAERTFVKEQEVYDVVSGRFKTIAEDAGARPDFVVIEERQLITTPTLEAEEETQLDSVFGAEEGVTTEGPQTFQTTSGKSFQLNFSQAEQPATPKLEGTEVTGKVKGILGDLAGTVKVNKKGGNNEVLGLIGGSLTFRTNNPLAITATGKGSAKRLTEKFGAIPNLFSPDSADNLVLNFRTFEDGIEAGKSLLEEKGGMTLSRLSESHTGTSAPGHKARLRQKGLDLNVRYRDLSEEDKQKVVEAFMEAEGFREGTKRGNNIL